MYEAAELMVREKKSLKEAATELGVPLGTVDIAAIGRRRSFQALVRAAADKFHTEVGTDPGLTKDKVAGLMLLLSEQLEKEGNAKEALTGLERLAKLKGWVGDGGNVNIFSGLTQRDIDEMKEKFGAARDGAGASASKPN